MSVFTDSVYRLDRRSLANLPLRQISNHLAGAVKYAVAASPELFDALEHVGPALLADRFQGSNAKLDDAADYVITTTASLARSVAYEHPFVPAIRALAPVLPGEAVSIDIAIATAVSHTRGHLDARQVNRIYSVTRRLGLPIWNPALAQPGALSAALPRAVPLPSAIGEHHLAEDLTPAEIDASADALARADHRYSTLGIPVAVSSTTSSWFHRPMQQ